MTGIPPCPARTGFLANRAVVEMRVSQLASQIADNASRIGETFGFSDEVTATASFTVRDDRDLSQVHQRDPGDPDPVASCDTYGGSAAVAG